MAYDATVATRVRRALRTRHGVSERKMFGGIAFLVDGHMCCGVLGADLVLRLGADQAARALTDPRVRPMDFTGKPMTGMVYVSPAGFASAARLRAWLGQAVAFVRTLPAKPPARPARPRSA